MERVEIKDFDIKKLSDVKTGLLREVAVRGKIAMTQNSPKNSTKLFVFGDSYVDTGNWPKNISGPWKEPFGKTFPGKPNGRASDGRILTDHIARMTSARLPKEAVIENPPPESSPKFLQYLEYCADRISPSSSQHGYEIKETGMENVHLATSLPHSGLIRFAHCSKYGKNSGELSGDGMSSSSVFLACIGEDVVNTTPRNKAIVKEKVLHLAMICLFG
ncbi:unnamed protein product [Dovyalis caffra]|uniref:GDSL esterase/lipase n=1 Tax=Dovyalis caffra TaxID=77055 RepID=A0AAV1QU04_9ROSI|nr:unnamed protein product [Dovyalis caffra]